MKASYVILIPVLAVTTIINLFISLVRQPTANPVPTVTEPVDLDYFLDTPVPEPMTTTPLEPETQTPRALEPDISIEDWNEGHEDESRFEPEPETLTDERFDELHTRYNMEAHGMPKRLSTDGLTTRKVEDVFNTPQPSMEWTKPDLIKACRCYGLKTTGNKSVLLARLEQRNG